MTIIRVSHDSRFTTIDNAAVRDSRISFKARGLHHLLLSYPDNWEVNINHLCQQSEPDTKHGISQALKELEAFGYLVKDKQRSQNDGRFLGWSYVIHELPTLQNEKSPNSEKFNIGHRHQKSPKSEISEVGNLEDINKEQYSKQKTNKEEKTPTHDGGVILSESAIAVAAEIIPMTSGFTDERVAPETLATLPNKPEITQPSDKSSLGSIVPAAFGNLEQSNKPKYRPDGREAFPWEVIDPMKGWTVDSGFASYVSNLVKDYSAFRGYTVKRFAREVINYINRAHYEPERREKLLGYWEDYQEGDEGVSMTVVEAVADISRSQEMERIAQASREKFVL